MTKIGSTNTSRQKINDSQNSGAGCGTTVCDPVGFTPLPVQKQYVIQGMGGRRSVAEDVPCMWLA